MKANNKSAQGAKANNVNNAKASAKDLTEFEKAYKNRSSISSACNDLFRAEFTSLKHCIDILLNHDAFCAKRANLTTLGIDLSALSASTFMAYIPSELVFTYSEGKKGTADYKEFTTILKKAFPKEYTASVKKATLAEYRRSTWSVRAVCTFLDKSIKK